MKKQLSDIEKTLIVIWIFIGGLIGALFIAPLYKQSPQVLGLIGIVVGAGIGYAFFREPPKRKHKQTSDQSAWLSDKFADNLMKRIYRAYNIREEPDEENEANLIQNDSIDDEQSPLRFWETLPIPSKILFGLAILWPIIFALIYYLFPKVVEPIKNAPSLKVLFILPICVVAGLNGLIILLQQNTIDETQEKPRGMIGYLIGILAILLGCGLGTYLIVVDLIGMEI